MGNLFRVISVGFSFLLLSNIGAEESFSPYVDDTGAISFPENFRSEMVHLGSWFVPDGEASGFHGVYTEKESLIAYSKLGHFPDGATLVKELRAARTANYTTGQNVNHANHNLKQWFVMIKDAKGRFPSNPVWGDGWGWALFKPNAMEKNVATNYTSDCLGCHIPAKDNDWVHIEAYPVLSESE